LISFVLDTVRQYLPLECIIAIYDLVISQTRFNEVGLVRCCTRFPRATVDVIIFINFATVFLKNFNTDEREPNRILNSLDTVNDSASDDGDVGGNSDGEVNDCVRDWTLDEIQATVNKTFQKPTMFPMLVVIYQGLSFILEKKKKTCMDAGSDENGITFLLYILHEGKTIFLMLNFFLNCNSYFFLL